MGLGRCLRFATLLIDDTDMTSPIQLIESSNPLTLIFVIWILAHVGHRIVQEEPRWHKWGLQLSALAFVAFGLYQVIHDPPSAADDLLPMLLQSLAFGGLVLGVSWILLPVVGVLIDRTIVVVVRRLRSSIAAETRRRQELRMQSQTHREREDAAREYARSAPERQRQLILAEVERQRAADEQNRRDKARADCLRLFLLLARDVKSRFTRKMFDEYASGYLSDNRPADDVEGHAEKLKLLMQQHYDKIEPPKKFRSLQDVACWFQSEKKNLEAIEDEKMRRSLIAKLNQRYAELTTQFFEEST